MKCQFQLMDSVNSTHLTVPDTQWPCHCLVWTGWMRRILSECHNSLARLCSSGRLHRKPCTCTLYIPGYACSIPISTSHYFAPGIECPWNLIFFLLCRTEYDPCFVHTMRIAAGFVNTLWFLWFHSNNKFGKCKHTACTTYIVRVRHHNS